MYVYASDRRLYRLAQSLEPLQQRKQTNTWLMSAPAATVENPALLIKSGFSFNTP